MKAIGPSLVLAVLLGMAATPAVWSVGPGGGGGGHGGFGGGAGGHFGGPGHFGSPGGGQPLNPAGPGPHQFEPLDREGLFDHGGLHDHPRDFGRFHGRARFGYPVCFAYPYCPYPVTPCLWEDGHWAGQPGYYDERAPTVYGAWVPPGCY